MSTSTHQNSTRIVAVGANMGATYYTLVRSREAPMMAHRQDEALAHAITLQFALDHASRAGRSESAQSLTDRLREYPKIEGVVLYDVDGRTAIESSPYADAGARSSADAAFVEQRAAAEREAEQRLALVRDIRHNGRLSLVVRLATGTAARGRR